MSWFALATYRTAGKGDAPAVVFDNRVYDARQALPGGLFLAFEQTAGRGRLGRSWSSPAGQGVYASRMLTVEPERLQTLPLLVGVGLCRALDPHLPTPGPTRRRVALSVADQRAGARGQCEQR